MKKLKADLVLAVDLDGVIAEYDGWKGHNVIGAPKKGAVEYLKRLRGEGWTIIVFTARYKVGVVEAYLRHWQVPFDAINRNINDWFRTDLHCKIFANVYLDDRSLDSIDKKWNWRKTYRKIRRKHRRFYEEAK